MKTLWFEKVYLNADCNFCKDCYFCIVKQTNSIMISNKILNAKFDELQQLLLSLESLSGFDTPCVKNLFCEENTFSGCITVTIVFFSQPFAVCFFGLLTQFNIVYPSINFNSITFRLFAYES